MKGRIWQLYIIAIIGIALVSEFLGTSRTIFAIDKVIKDGESIEIVIDENADSTTEKFSVRKDGVSTASTGTELFTIQESGNVGIRTPNPTRDLEITSVGDVLIRANADSDGLDGGPRSISFGVREEIVDGDGNLGFAVRDETDGGAYRFFINKIGNVGIGEVSPGARLDVEGADSLNTTLAGHIRGATGTGLVITNAGNVGIGSNSPAAKLEISSVGNVTIRANADTDGFDGGPRTISFGIVEEIVDGDQNLGFAVRDETAGGAYRFFINKSGNVGIGMTNLLPMAKLDVALGNNEEVLLTGDGSNPFRFSMRSAGEQTYFLRHSGTSNLFQIGFDLNAGGQQYAVTVNSGGNVGIGTTAPQHPLHMGSGAHVTAGGVWTNASSREYKENIRDLTVDEAVATLDGLRPTKFNYKVDKEDECLGFIAEDVPQLVATNDRKGLSPMDFTTVLTKVVQEQQRMLKEQQEAMSEMKQEIQMLKSAVNYNGKGL